jgi:glyoxylase-like metal-dependent hydrolase (beta-lactamase superfamily II)
MTKMILRVRPVGPWQVNAYVLACPETGESVLVDPGAEPETLEEMLAGTRAVAVLLTHSHGDHTGALDEIRSALRVPVMAHPAFAGGAIDRGLPDGATLAVGRHRLTVLHAPGHTPDQICIRVEGEEKIIVGDTIFEGGPGKTWRPEDFQNTLVTLRRVVLAWPDATRCYPGHGSSFRLGDIRRDIEAFLARDHGRFCGDAVWEM